MLLYELFIYASENEKMRLSQETSKHFKQSSRSNKIIAIFCHKAKFHRLNIMIYWKLSGPLPLSLNS